MSKVKIAISKPAKEIEPVEYELAYSEFFRLSRILESYHAVFYQLWELGKPFFTRDISTAAVRFDKKGRCIQFLFNIDFWNSLDDKKKAFVISHECLHVLLKHGIRGMTSDKNKAASNVAMDVVINEMLLNHFGFSVDDIDPDRNYCWISTIFKDENGNPLDYIEKEETYEYYYNRLPESSFGSTILVDIHDFLNGIDTDAIIEELNKTLSDEDKEMLNDFINSKGRSADSDDDDDENSNKKAGTGSSTGIFSLNNKKVKPKKKWETVIKKWSKKFLRTDFDSFEHWVRANRRMVELPEDIILPTEMELQDKEEKNAIDVFFFLDVSGSCIHLADRFWDAARSLPKSRFRKRLFTFDTAVEEVFESDKSIKGGGGTAFDIIEQKIQQEIASKKCKKPPFVFIITDGYGNKVTPQFPDKWYWFLTEHHSKEFIPNSSKKFELKNFE